MDPVTIESVKKHEAHISRAVMQAIGSAKDLSPALYDFPDQQEIIVNACKDTAQAVFKFRNQVKEQVTSALNISELQENLTNLEKTLNRISDVINKSNAPKVNITGVKVFRENLEEVSSKTSHFNIFLGKLRIASGLKTLAKISQNPEAPFNPQQAKAHMQLETRERGASSIPEYQPKYQQKLKEINEMGGNPSNQSNLLGSKSSYDLPIGERMSLPNRSISSSGVNDNSKKGFDKLILSPNRDSNPFDQPVLEALEEVLKSYQHRTPTSMKSELLASELRQIDLKWPLFLLQDEILRRRDAESKLIKLLDGSKIQQLVEAWKEKMTKIYDRKVQEKEEIINQKDSQLKRILEVQSKILELKRKGEVGGLEKMQYEKELEKKDKEIQELKKKAVEAEQKASSTTNKLNEYISEVEDWKNELTETYQEELHEKDKEIFELKNTVALLMQKDARPEEGNLVNQLLEFIGNDKSKEDSFSRRSLIVANNSPTFGEKKIPAQPTPISSSLAKISPHSVLDTNLTLKVELPQGAGYYTYSIQPHANLATLLGEIRKARKIDTSNLGFQYPDVDPFAPVLPLESKLVDLGTLSLRLVDKTSENYKGQTLDSKSGISHPFNAYHYPRTGHSTLDQIMSLMDNDLDLSRPEFTLINECEDWELELYNPNTTKFDEEKNRSLKDLGKNTPYYKAYISRTEHTNYVAFAESSKKFGAIVISIPKPLKGATKIQALIRTKFDDEFIMLTSNFSESDIIKTLKGHFGEKLGKDVKIKKLSAPNAQNEILETEEKLMTKGYKFGLLYRKKGQTDENDMFSNKHQDASPEYKEFLKFLGKEITLNGFTEYRGGLDVKNNTTGETSIFTKHLGFGVMFHVSTLLPFQIDDEQRLERKRHLGNDVVFMVFQDDVTPFDPSWIRAEFPHVFCVVSPTRDNNKLKFKIAFAFKGGVGIPNPPLPLPCVFDPSEDFRQFLLTKLINAERNAMYAPSFVTKVQRTRELQLDDLVNRLMDQKKSSRGSLHPSVSKNN